MTREELIAKCLDAKRVGTQLVHDQRTYLILRHFGVPDADMVVDETHGVIVRAANQTMKDRKGSRVAPDVENWTCFDVVDGKLVGGSMPDTGHRGGRGL